MRSGSARKLARTGTPTTPCLQTVQRGVVTVAELARGGYQGTSDNRHPPAVVAHLWPVATSLPRPVQSARWQAKEFGLGGHHPDRRSRQKQTNGPKEHGDHDADGEHRKPHPVAIHERRHVRAPSRERRDRHTRPTRAGAVRTRAAAAAIANAGTPRM
jgi:hypothetical protein